MLTVYLVTNIFESDGTERFKVTNVVDFLLSKFDTFPSNARIYKNFVSVSHEVTPRDEAGVEKLKNETDGEFWVICYPKGGAEWVAYAIAAVLLVAAIVMRPKIPTIPGSNNAVRSGNNELSSRTNRPRINGRIPDIYGKVRSVPDLIANPYSIFENNREVEVCSYCVGRGEYLIEDVKDDTTLVSSISEMSVEFYNPGKSPNAGDMADLTIGQPIETEIKMASRSNSVNGQTLDAPNKFVWTAEGVNFYLKGPNKAIFENVGFFVSDFRKYFEAGQTVEMTDAKATYDQTDVFTCSFISSDTFRFEIASLDIPAGFESGSTITIVGTSTNKEDFFVVDTLSLSGEYVILTSTSSNIGGNYYLDVKLTNPSTISGDWALVTSNSTGSNLTIKTSIISEYDFSGVYEVSSVSEHELTFLNPALVNDAWDSIQPDLTTPNMAATLSGTGDNWVGPFVVDGDMDQLVLNFQAPNGIYWQGDSNIYVAEVSVLVEITKINDQGNPEQPIQEETLTLLGTGTNDTNLGMTKIVTLDWPGRSSVRVKRTSERNLAFKGTMVDEVKWKDLIALESIGDIDFGDVTLAMSKTVANTGSLAIKERKLNALVTRKLPTRVSGSTFSTELTETTQVDDIISAVCLDPKIGGRLASEIDFDSLYDQVQLIRDYFGTSKASEFNYTFDSDNLSFEEIMNTICEAVFCTPYRVGNKIKIFFEKETEIPTLLFNHRNKIPRTEARQITFGNFNDNDGIEFEYVNPDDDTTQTLYIPASKEYVNPKRMESVGVRNKLQAYFLANRAYNRLKYQNTVVEFDSTVEGNILVPSQMILVTDGTRNKSYLEGEVVYQSGLTLTLSQDYGTLPTGAVIHLQLSSGAVESIAVSAGADSTQVILASAPSIPLVYEFDSYAKTTYFLCGQDDTEPAKFIVSEKSPKGNTSVGIQAVKYSTKFYSNDSDFINGIVDLNGNTI